MTRDRDPPGLRRARVRGETGEARGEGRGGAGRARGSRGDRGTSYGAMRRDADGRGYPAGSPYAYRCVYLPKLLARS